MKRIFLENAKLLGNGACAGAVLGCLGYIVSESFENSFETKTAFRNYEYLQHSEDLTRNLLDLRSLLEINDYPGYQKSFHALCQLMNIVAGYELLIDSGNFLSCELNYTLRCIEAQVNRCLESILNQKFRLVSLSQDVCTIVEKIEEIMKNLLHNAHQELQVRLSQGTINIYS